MKRRYSEVFLRGECHSDMSRAVTDMVSHGALYLGCKSWFVGYGPDGTYVYEMRVGCDNTCPLPSGAETPHGGMHRVVFGGNPRTFDVEIVTVRGVPVKLRKSKRRGDFAPHA